MSKTINTIRGGTPHESLSEYVGRKYYEEHNDKYYAFVNVIDCFFMVLGEVDHVYNSLNGEKMAKDIWDGGK